MATRLAKEDSLALPVSLQPYAEHLGAAAAFG
eukprot:COSAG01_NODE_62743_length_283_cov_0.777174_1_plen_31_part_10